MLCRCSPLLVLLFLLACEREDNALLQSRSYLYVYDSEMKLCDSVLAYFADSGHHYLLAERTFNAHRAKDSVEFIQGVKLSFKMLKLQHQKFGVVVYADSVVSIYKASNDGFYFVTSVQCKTGTVTAITATDVDGDGDKDLLVTGSEGVLPFLFDAASQNLRYGGRCE